MANVADTPSNEFLMLVQNLYSSIPIKSIRNLLSGKIVHSTPTELVFDYGNTSYLFIYRFGCIAHFNMPESKFGEELGKIKKLLGDPVAEPTTESYIVKLSEAGNLVEFEHVALKKMSLDNLRFVAMTLGQSAGLEYFELSADKMLFETFRFLENLAQTGRSPLYDKRLLKIIGSIASTRQQIISNLAILDPPEETWKSKELEKLYRELEQNFDIDVRFKTLDRKLSLIQDNVELLSDLTVKYRSAVLETLIVVLIVLEIVLAFVH